MKNTLKNEIKEGINWCVDTNENENKTIQNLWDTGKAILREEFITLQAYLKNKINKQTKKPRRSSNKQYNFILKGSRKRATKKAKTSRKKETIKIRAEINEIGPKNDTKDQWIQELFFEKINKIGKPLTRLIKKKRDRIQINKIRNKEEKLQMIPQKYKGL